MDGRRETTLNPSSVLCHSPGDSTVRPTMRPARRSSSAACAWLSGRSRVGIGAIFPARARSSSSRASAKRAGQRSLDRHGLDGEHRGGDRERAAEQSRHHDLAAARKQRRRKLQRLFGADEIADRQQARRSPPSSPGALADRMGRRPPQRRPRARPCASPHRCRRRSAVCRTTRARSQGPSCRRRRGRRAAQGRARRGRPGA